MSLGHSYNNIPINIIDIDTCNKPIHTLYKETLIPRFTKSFKFTLNPIVVSAIIFNLLLSSLHKSKISGVITLALNKENVIKNTITYHITFIFLLECYLRYYSK